MPSNALAGQPPAATAPLLEVSGLGYTYPTGVQALRGLDVRIGQGELVAVVGPSGCGKSTLLSVLAELTPATSGAVTWKRDRPVAAGTAPIAMVFQRDTVFPWRTVEKNVEFGMECRGVGREARRARVHSLLSMVGLEDFKTAHPRTLSGGMRRRLALVMSLAVSPQVLLLDEPFAALDEPTRVGLYVDLLNLVYELGISVVLVTHDIAEAITIADRIHVLTRRPGRISATYEIPFGHDRDPWTIRAGAEYAEVYRQIWTKLSGEITDVASGAAGTAMQTHRQ